MKIIFDELAQLELDEASEYYELQVPGLGERFRKEVKRAIYRIHEYYDAWPKETGDVRRYLLHKFPYKILYSLEREYIYIIAIAHSHRRPNYWIERILNES